MHSSDSGAACNQQSNINVVKEEVQYLPLKCSGVELRSTTKL